jgi:hypothetical protein
VATIVLVSPAQHGCISVRTFLQSGREASHAPQGGIGRKKGFSAKEMDNSTSTKVLKVFNQLFASLFASPEVNICVLNI